MQHTQSRIWGTYGLCAVGLIASACSAVNSSELKSTTAVDLKIVAQIHEDRASNSVPVTAQMRTAASDVGIQFTNGEKLQASCDAAQGLSAKVLLSITNDFLGADFDHVYESAIPRANAGGNYYLTYTDGASATTTTNVPTGSVAPILTPSESAVVTPGVVHITWDPKQMPTTGDIMIQASYQGASSSGYASKNKIPNTGAYDLDLAWFSGTGSIKLASQVTYTNLPGFAKSDVLMDNFDEVTVQFGASASASKSAGSKALTATGAVTNDETTVDEILHMCLHQCDVGEKSGFTVGEQEYSCCEE